VSEDTTNREILFDREALIAALKGDERFRALTDAVAESEEKWTQRALALFLGSAKPFDQRKIDFMRGYFAGARYTTGGRITAAEQRMAQSGLHETEESDTDV
jgi:hypothetical protein